MGEGEGRMIWENGIETCIISYKKRITSPGSMQDTGCLGLVCWDDPEGHDTMKQEAAGNRTNSCTSGLRLSVPTKEIVNRILMFLHTKIIIVKQDF